MFKSLAIREVHIKTTMRYLYTSIRMAKIKIVTIPNASENEPKLDHRYIASRNIKWCSHSRIQLGSFL